MIRLPSPLTDETESRIHRVIGCCINVHRELGPGLLEGIYRRALCVELRHAGLEFETEKRVMVSYRGEPLCHQRVDLLIGGTVLLELKAVRRLARIHRARIISYLRATHLRVGLLVNFHAATIPAGLRRIVL
jgi:GxxExxY protein